MLSERNGDCLYNTYYISRDTFQIYALWLNVRADDHVPTEDIIIVYEGQLKAGLRFLIDPFYTNFLNFYKLSIAQLYPNS